MHKSILLKTNLIVCLVIVLVFAVVFTIDYQISLGADMENIESISSLTSESIYYQMQSIFSEPVNVSLTMANDILLKAYLLNENHEEDKDYIQLIQDYLNAYKEKYGYDSVFLVSAKTRRYYNFNGIDRVLRKANPENEWFYDFLESGVEYSLNVDNDEAAGNEITVFINCAIIDDEGSELGIVGVGFQIDSLQELLLEYAESSGVDIYLINKSGNIELALDSTGWQPENFFDICGYPQFEEEILQNSETRETLSYWHKEPEANNYIVSRYIPDFGWHLIVEHNTISLENQMDKRLKTIIFAAIITVLIASLVITYTIRRYNKQIIELTALIEQEKHAAVKQELTRKAETDGLTNLYDKKATEYYIRETLINNPERNCALLMLDMDNLRLINEYYGHAGGDLAIRKFADIIKSQFREGDIVGRVGGDEFIVFLTVPSIEFATKKIAVLSGALDTECTEGSMHIKISASIGVAFSPQDGADFETLYKNADAALYETKKRGKNGYTVYEPQEHTGAASV